MARGRKPKTQSQGLGDTIAKITKAIGIEPCSECEERRQKLNDLFGYKLKVINFPNESDTEFIKSIGLNLDNDNRKRLCKLYADTFDLPYFEPCVNCSPKPYLVMIERLKNAI